MLNPRRVRMLSACLPQAESIPATQSTGDESADKMCDSLFSNDVNLVYPLTIHVS